MTGVIAAGGGAALCVGRVLLEEVLGRDRLEVVVPPVEVFGAVLEVVGELPPVTVVAVFRVAMK